MWHDGADARGAGRRSTAQGAAGACRAARRSATCCAAYGERNQVTLERRAQGAHGAGQAGGRARRWTSWRRSRTRGRGARARAARRRRRRAARARPVPRRLQPWSWSRTAAGRWSKPSPLAMRRAPGMRPLPLPVQGAGDALGELRGLLGFDGAEHDAFWALFVGFMFSACAPTRRTSCSGSPASRGRARRTTASDPRAPIDPHEIDIQPKPKYRGRPVRQRRRAVAHRLRQPVDASTSIGATRSAGSRRARATPSASCTPTATPPGSRWRGRRSSRRSSTWSRRPTCWTAHCSRSCPSSASRRRRGGAAGRGRRAGAARARPAARRRGSRAQAPAHGQAGHGPAHGRADASGSRPRPSARAGAGQFLAAYLDSRARAGEMALEVQRDRQAAGRHAAGSDALARLAEKTGDHARPCRFRGHGEAAAQRAERVPARQACGLGRGWPRAPRGMGAALRRIAPALRKARLRGRVRDRRARQHPHHQDRHPAFLCRPNCT